MNALAGLAQLVVDLWTLTGAAAYLLIAFYLLAVAGRWFVRHRYLPGEYRRLAEWTRAVEAYVEEKEQDAERRICETIEAWEGWGKGYNRYWICFAMAAFEHCATASPDEVRQWRDYARTLKQRGAGPLLFAYDLAVSYAERRGDDAAAEVRSAFPYLLIDDDHLPAWQSPKFPG